MNISFQLPMSQEALLKKEQACLINELNLLERTSVKEYVDGLVKRIMKLSSSHNRDQLQLITDLFNQKVAPLYQEFNKEYITEDTMKERLRISLFPWIVEKFSVNTLFRHPSIVEKMNQSLQSKSASTIIKNFLKEYQQVKELDNWMHSPAYQALKTYESSEAHILNFMNGLEESEKLAKKKKAYGKLEYFPPQDKECPSIEEVQQRKELWTSAYRKLQQQQL